MAFMFPLSANDRLARRRLLIDAIHRHDVRFYNVFQEFQGDLTGVENTLATIDDQVNKVLGDVATVQDQLKLLTNVSTPQTIIYPSNLTINANGQITSAVKAKPQGPFTIRPTAKHVDVVSASPYTITSVPNTTATIDNKWSGRWITDESFNGTIKASFRINSPPHICGDCI